MPSKARKTATARQFIESVGALHLQLVLIAGDRQSPFNAVLLSISLRGRTRGASAASHETARVKLGGSSQMKKSLIIAAASVFAAGTFAGAQAQTTNHCAGVNACKGQSACKTANSSCKGQNACKGQGWVETGTTLECVAIGGKPLM
jgi:hypothetical protein